MTGRGIGSPGVTVPTRAEQEELFRRMRPPHSPAVMAGARDELIRRNTPILPGLVAAARRRWPDVPADDLFGWAAVALCESVDRFDVDLGFAFSTYAMRRIPRKLRYHVLADWPLVAVPMHVHQRARRAEREGADPESDPLVRAGRRAAACRGGAPPHADPAAPGPGHDPEELAAAVAGSLGRVGAAAAKVVRLRHGLGGAAPLTGKQIGARLGISKQRVRQIEARAYAAMAADLEDFRT